MSLEPWKHGRDLPFMMSTKYCKIWSMFIIFIHAWSVKNSTKFTTAEQAFDCYLRNPLSGCRNWMVCPYWSNYCYCRQVYCKQVCLKTLIVQYMLAQKDLIHDLLFLPISTIESAVGKRLITHCCVSHLACSCLSGHTEPHSPQLQAWNQHNYDVMN